MSLQRLCGASSETPYSKSGVSLSLWIVEAAHLTAPEAAKNVASQALPTPPLSHSNSS